MRPSTRETPVTPSETSATAAMEKTPQAHKAAAREFVQTAELTQLQVNLKNGAKSIPFKRPIRVRLGGRTRDFALRAREGRAHQQRRNSRAAGLAKTHAKVEKRLLAKG